MENFVEIQNWGFNTLILSSMMTMVFSIFQGYGFVIQGRKIFKEKSAKSLSLPMFFLFFSYFIAFAIYGLDQKSIAITFNGLLFIPVLPIVIGIFKFKEIKTKDIALFVAIMMIVPTMIIMKNKDLLLAILLLVNIIVLLSQAITIVKEKSIGVIEIKFIKIFLLTSCCWLIYSIWIINLPLIVFNSIAIILYVDILISYKKYKTKK